MNPAEWDPVYEVIRREFGYDRAADEQARDVLWDLLPPFALTRLDVEGSTVAIAGGAATLEDDLAQVDASDAVFAASNAATVLLEHGFEVDCMITDLDKQPATARNLTHEATPVAVHAHGDNTDSLRRWVPKMDVDHVLGTTQVEPRPPIRNFGGFTDGDRAAFLADHLNADSLVFPGWDFEDTSVGAEKQRKLQWAARLLTWLEYRRNDRFDVLDGIRDDIDLSSIIG